MTDEEEKLVQSITLRPPQFGDMRAIYLKNEQSVLALMESLMGRDAIPEVRLKYWEDPECRTNRRYKSSYKEQFEEHNRTDQCIYAHLGFLPFLRYFLFGPDLPKEVISSFEMKVESLGWITSGDVEPICKHARLLSRRFNLKDRSVPKEFYKLCREIDFDYARIVMENVKKAQRSLR